MNVKFILMALFLGIPGLLLMGAEPVETPDHDELMVVTAQFAPESAKDSIYKVRVIDSKTIRESASRDLRDLLEHELQMDLEQSSVFGTSVSMQGLSFENVKILYDGVPVIGRLNGMIDLSHIGLDGIERVEIIEGPVSVHYGTDALAGVINLIPRRGAENGPLSISLDGQYDSVGSGSREIRGSFFNGKNSLDLGVGDHQFDGYSLDSQARKDDWSERDQLRGDLRYTRHGQNLDLSYEGRFFSEDLTDRGLPQEGLAQDTVYTTERYGHRISLNGAVSERARLEFFAAYSDYERRSAVWNADLNGGSTTRSTASRDSDFTGFEQWTARGQYAWENVSGNLGYQVGFETVIETGTGARILTGSQEVTEYAGFAGIRYQFPWGLEVQPAIRYTHNSAYNSPATPALNMRYGGRPGEFRLSYSKGFRSPSLKQLFLDFTLAAGPRIYHIVGNESLKAERGDSYNLSHVWRTTVAGKGKIRLESSLFYNDIQNLIELGLLLPDPSNPGHFNRTYLNIREHKTRGGKLQASWRQGRFSVGSGLAITDVLNVLAESSVVPQFNTTLDGKLDLGYEYASIRGNLFYKYNGEETGWQQARGAAEPEETRLEAWHQMDAGLSRRFFNETLEFAVGVKNLFDVTDLDHVGQASGAAHSVDHLSWGRSYYVDVRYVWKK